MRFKPFRLFLLLLVWLAVCRSSGWDQSGTLEKGEEKFNPKSQKELHNETNLGGKGMKCENRKANEINLIIKKCHKMDWSHLEMPFVLSLSLPFFFFYYFHFTFPYLLSVGICVFIISPPPHSLLPFTSLWCGCKKIRKARLKRKRWGNPFLFFGGESSATKIDHEQKTNK